jgi:hypothetical protein
MGIIIAKVPQLVPVEKEITQDVRNTTLGRRDDVKNLLAIWATYSPVLSSLQTDPMAKANVLKDS